MKELRVSMIVLLGIAMLVNTIHAVAQELTYGDTIILQHFNTKKFLTALPKKYNHSTGSGQWAIAATENDDQSQDILWIVEAGVANGDVANPVSVGKVVNAGDTISLRSVGKGYRLHSHAGHESPTTRQGEVTGFELAWGKNGQGDMNDNWRFVDAPVDGGVVRLEHILTNQKLHSHDVNQYTDASIVSKLPSTLKDKISGVQSKISDALDSKAASFNKLLGRKLNIFGDDALQEVTTFGGNDSNDNWVLKIVNAQGTDVESVSVEPSPSTPSTPIVRPIEIPENPGIAPAPIVNIPSDMFDEEAGAAVSIAVGSREAELEVWCIGTDANLYRYDNYTMNTNPWVKMDAKDITGTSLGALDSVSVSSDGEMCLLTASGKAYRYNWTSKNFEAMVSGSSNENIRFNCISVGGARTVWAADTNNNIYCYGDKGWELVAQDVGVDVAVGVDGTVYAINTAGSVFTYLGNKRWKEIATVRLDDIAVGDKHNVYGVYKSELYQLVDGIFAPVKDKVGKTISGVKEIAVNAAGTLFFTDINHDIYHKGDAGVVITQKAPPVAPDEKPQVVIEKAPEKTGAITREQASKKGFLKRGAGKKAAKDASKKAAKKAQVAGKNPAKKAARRKNIAKKNAQAKKAGIAKKGAKNASKGVKKAGAKNAKKAAVSRRGEKSAQVK